MALDVADAVRDGVERATAREAVPLVAAFFVVQVVSTVAVQSQGARLAGTEQETPFADAGLFPEGGPLALDLPLGVITVLSLSSVALLSLVLVLALRAFVDEGSTGNLAVATLWGMVVLFAFPPLFALGLAALVVPGLLFAVTMAFVPAYVAVEGDNVVRAMVESWRLTRNHWLRTLLLLVVDLALLLLVSLLGAVPAGLLSETSPVAGTLLQSAVAGVSLTLAVAVLAAAFDQLRTATPAADDELADIDDELLP